MLTCNDIFPGIQRCELNLSLLYPSVSQRQRFEDKWPDFYNSDPDQQNIFSRSDADTLTYITESLIPTHVDSRPPLLFLLGNPASHSVASGIPFAYEQDNKEHRFWRVLRHTGILDLIHDSEVNRAHAINRNRVLKARFFTLQYNSPFRVGIDVFYSMPSAASGQQWSGVAGLRRLLGSAAMRKLARLEEVRLAELMHSFIPVRGCIFTFQKDAYEGLRAPGDPPYSINLAKTGQLSGRCKFNPGIRLFGCPPTRLMNGKAYQALLMEFKDSALQYGQAA
ncbi:MAG: hypothetical protein P1S60_08620 [Anaerolineae bacterium]|nr:hypothetical protein [Anaerolineae bacterium]